MELCLRSCRVDCWLLGCRLGRRMEMVVVVVGGCAYHPNVDLLLYPKSDCDLPFSWTEGNSRILETQQDEPMKRVSEPLLHQHCWREAEYE
jgi:hypothetical protein